MPVASFEIAGQRITLPTGGRFREKTAPFFWPLVGDYPIYDKYIYAVMTADDERAVAYHEAIRGMAEGRVVVEIGTGDQAHWARSCARAGARKVFAIEANMEALEKASNLIAGEGLADMITLIPGRSGEVDLPEKADLSVSEIIGEIGGSEGAAAILNDVRHRFLKPDARSIPAKCRSWCCPVQLPDPLQTRPIIEKMGIPYVQKIFELAGEPFDLRLSVDNCFEALTENLLSDAQILEELDFSGFCDVLQTQRTSFEIARSGTLTGLLIWIELFVGESIPALSSLKAGSNWRPVYCPLFDPGLPLDAGARVEIEWKTSISPGQTHPDYDIRCTIPSEKRTETSTLRWPHLGGGNSFHQNRFYRRLFSTEDRHSSNDFNKN